MPDLTLPSGEAAKEVSRLALQRVKGENPVVVGLPSLGRVVWPGLRLPAPFILPHHSRLSVCFLRWPAATELQAAVEDGKLALKAREARIEELEAAAAAASESATDAQVGRRLEDECWADSGRAPEWVVELRTPRVLAWRLL